ncbi:MAG: hypothetical protein ACHQ3P_06275 [Candidatus Limnocylindrales bacterium]
MTAGATVEAVRRPFGITAVVVLQLATAAWIASGIVGIRPLDPTSLAGQISDSLPNVEAIFGVLTVILVVASVGLWFVHRWAWVASMLLTGFQLAFLLVSIWQGGSDWVRLLLLTITALYLNQRSVIDLFGDRQPREVPLPIETDRGPVG